MNFHVIEMEAAIQDAIMETMEVNLGSKKKKVPLRNLSDWNR